MPKQTTDNRQKKQVAVYLEDWRELVRIKAEDEGSMADVVEAIIKDAGKKKATEKPENEKE